MGNIIKTSPYEKNILNIYLFGDSEDFNSYGRKNVKQKNDSYNWINEFSKKEFRKKDFDSIIDDIILGFQKKNNSNCILIFLDNRDYNDKADLIYKCLKNLKRIYKPIVILAINDDNKIKNEKNVEETPDYQNKKSNSKIDKNIDRNKYFEIAYYNKNNYSDIYEKIKTIYNYYFNISDGITNFIPIINDFVLCKENFENESIMKYKATLNVLIIGRPGCGKSTLINLLLNERRAREGLGYSITRLYSQYVHKKYPITFTDTPGFEDDESLKQMERFLSIYNTFFKKGRNKYHLVLYLINTSNERSFLGIELYLIDYINKNLNIPIFFVCTHSRTEESSIEFKEEVKISLIQKFGLKTDLIEHIYCCHLINEKDGIYKRFGIDKLLNKIKHHFLNELKIIKKIEKDFKNEPKQEIVSFSKESEKCQLNILSGLENSNSYSQYLKNLSLNIIDVYLSEISKIFQNSQNNLDKKKVSTKIYELLKKHLSFELNWESSRLNIDENYIDFSKDSYNQNFSCFPEKDDNYNKNDELFLSFKKKITCIQKYILDTFQNGNQDTNTYIEKAIQNYEDSINSFDYISNDIIQEFDCQKINDIKQ